MSTGGAKTKSKNPVLKWAGLLPTLSADLLYSIGSS